MSLDTRSRIRQALDCDFVKSVPLAGGCIGDVQAVDLSDGRCVVVKSGGHQLDLEAWMLKYLAARSPLPVPDVLHAEKDLLILSYIETDGAINAAAQQDAATHLARLHGVTGRHFGLERDTLIGGLPQPNSESSSWLKFFAEHRLLYMGRQALDAGCLPAPTFKRIEALCGFLGRWIDEPSSPALIHGDIWSGNILCHHGRITAFVDPAIYYADPEIELAFSTLYDTFSDVFFDRYQEHRPLAPGFFEERRDLYNLYPLLVHVHLFGRSYLSSVERILKKFGF